MLIYGQPDIAILDVHQLQPIGSPILRRVPDWADACRQRYVIVYYRTRFHQKGESALEENLIEQKG